MEAFTSWASSQPGWVQVIIGLSLFFVALPLVLGFLYALWNALAHVAQPIGQFVENASNEIDAMLAPVLGPIKKMVRKGMLVLVTVGLIWIGLNTIGDLSWREDRNLVLALLAICAAILLPFVIYASSKKTRSTIAEWRAAIGADRDPEA